MFEDNILIVKLNCYMGCKQWWNKFEKLWVPKTFWSILLVVGLWPPIFACFPQFWEGNRNNWGPTKSLKNQK